MTKWIRQLMLRHAPTPQKAAASMLVDARMQLFTAEQRVIDADLQLKYWRARVELLEDIEKRGIQLSCGTRADSRIEKSDLPSRGPRLASGG